MLLAASAAGAAEARGSGPQDPTKTVLDAIAAGRWTVVDAEAPAIRDPLARKIVAWYALTERRDGTTFDEIAAFMRANPDWPWMGKLRTRAEAAPIVAMSDADLLAWFEKFPPVSTEGSTLYIEALRRLGREAEAKALIRKTWLSGRFYGRDMAFLARFGGDLTAADHAARLDTLLWQGAQGDARDLLGTGLVAEPDASIARARLVLGSKRLSSEAEVMAALDKVPAANRNHSGLRYDLTRWYRQSAQDGKAVENLKSPGAELDNPKRWWTERAIQVRRLLREGDSAGAYELARNHRQSGDGDFAEAEWLAGWIALRFVNKPALALEHFQRLSAVSSYPVSKARAAYWSGRAARDLGDVGAAQRFYAEASAYPTTFYGQFASARLGRSSYELPAALTTVSAAETAAFEKRELVRAARLLARVGQDDLVRPFIAELFRGSDAPAEWLLAGKLALALRQPDLAVRGYKFSKRPLELATTIGYPTIQVPAGMGAERALVLGLIRQESEFYAKAVSPAGARGLMQLMPATAQRTAKSLKIGFATGKLTEDPQYNTRLGTAHLAELIADWQGSYVLALAAYNAGSGAVTRWIEANGDPRAASNDAVIDWIESIPYSETRNYVQRVLEAFQVYRARLGDKRLATASLAENWHGLPANLASDGEALCTGGAPAPAATAC